MTAVWPLLGALFAWWFFTGAILCRVRLADRAGPAAHRRSVVLSLPLLGLGIVGLVFSTHMASAAGVYLGFLSALVVWGWIELAFLSGQITGPNDKPCPQGARGAERFLRAWGTLAHHEVLLVVALGLIALATIGQPNWVALATFATLFAARISAKLNLFFGVPRINTHFLPSTLAHLPSYFRHRRMNAVFPVSVVLLAIATAVWANLLMTAQAPWLASGHALLAAITALALLEHLFMVLPLPDDKLWRWMLPAPKPAHETP